MREYALRRFQETTCEECHCCGMLLLCTEGHKLSDFFVMDIQSNFYCAECDSIFEDGDERIFMEDEE